MLYTDIVFRVKITARTEWEVAVIRAALLFVRRSSFKRNIRFINGIGVHPYDGYNNELFPTTGVWICQRGTISESSIVYLASLLVHEGYHAEKGKKGDINFNSSQEPAAYALQIKFLRKYGTSNDVKYVTGLRKGKHWLHVLKSKSRREGYLSAGAAIRRYHNRVTKKMNY